MVRSRCRFWRSRSRRLRELGARLVEYLARQIDCVADSGDLVAKRRQARHRLLQDRKPRADLHYGRTRQVDRIEEVGHGAERQRLEKPPLDGQAGERFLETDPGPEREERVDFEIAGRFACRAECGGNRRRLGRGRQIVECSGPEWCQREAGDSLDDAIEFKRSQGKHHENHDVTTSTTKSKTRLRVLRVLRGQRYRWLIILAMQPAPNPLSMFTTDTPLAQEFSMPSSAAIPPKLAP